jgi:hypothetical protein
MLKLDYVGYIRVSASENGKQNIREEGWLSKWEENICPWSLHGVVGLRSTLASLDVESIFRLMNRYLQPLMAPGLEARFFKDTSMLLWSRL